MDTEMNTPKIRSFIVSYKKSDIDAMISDLKYIEGFLTAKLQKDQADIVARISTDLGTKGIS